MQDLPCRFGVQYTNQYFYYDLLTRYELFKSRLVSLHNDPSRILWCSCQHFAEGLHNRLDSKNPRANKWMLGFERVRLRFKPFCCQRSMHHPYTLIGSLFNSLRTILLYTLPCGKFLLRWCNNFLRCRKKFSFWFSSMFNSRCRFCCIFWLNGPCYLPCWYLHVKFCNNLCSLSCRKFLLSFKYNCSLWWWHKSCCRSKCCLRDTSNILLSKNNCNNFNWLWSLRKRKILFCRYNLLGLYN